MNKKHRVTRELLGALFLASLTYGCASFSRTAVPNFLKSEEQVRLERADKDLAVVRKRANERLQGKRPKNEPPLPTPTNDTNYARNRWRWDELNQLFDRKAELEAIVAQATARLDKQVKRRGYFALGSKTAAVGMGVGIAALTIANPAANAVWIAGLGAGAAGLAGIESRADDAGFSQQALQAKGDDLSAAVAKAASGFGDLSETRLRAVALSAPDTEWTNLMHQAGKALNDLEIAARYTRSKVIFITVPVTNPPVTKPPGT